MVIRHQIAVVTVLTGEIFAAAGKNIGQIVGVMVRQRKQIDPLVLQDLPAFPPLLGASRRAALDGKHPGVPLPTAAQSQQTQILKIPSQGQIVKLPLFHRGVVPQKLENRFGQNSGLHLAVGSFLSKEFLHHHISQLLGMAVAVFRRYLVVNTDRMAAVTVVAVAVVHLPGKITVALVQSIIKGVFQVGAGLEIIDSFLHLQQMSIDKQPHAAVAPIGDALVVGTVLCHQVKHPGKVLFGFLYICIGFLSLSLHGIAGGSQSRHVDPVVVLVKVGGPTAAVGITAIVEHHLSMVTDLTEDPLLFLFGKIGLQPVVPQRKAKQYPGRG